MNAPRILIDELSATSLRLEVRGRGIVLGTATGFTVEHAGSPFLVTNWHVVAGRDPDTGQTLATTGAIPDEVRIVYHAATRLGEHVEHCEPLLANGRRMWVEHPSGQTVDVVALPIRPPTTARIYAFDLTLADADVLLQVAMPVSIIGYPYGLTTGGAWPIWKTGHVASDPELDYQNRPVFLIDATTRGGMSGSPVVLRQYGSHTDRNRNIVLGADGTRFLGVYAGRIHGDAEIGRVWRPHLVNEILSRV